MARKHYKKRKKDKFCAGVMDKRATTHAERETVSPMNYGGYSHSFNTAPQQGYSFTIWKGAKA